MIYCLNGRFVSSFGASPTNRGFSYGDGFFETMIARQSQIKWFDYHYDRIVRGLKAYGFEGEFMGQGELCFLLSNLLKINCLSDARLKIFFWRSGEGLFTPQTDKFEYLILCGELVNNILRPVYLGISRQWQVFRTPLSGFKPLSASVYVMVSREAKILGFDDLILLNFKNQIVETSNSNVFWKMKDGTFCTPALETGCVDGVCRRVVMEHLRTQGFEVREVCAHVSELSRAVSVFLTNVSGIRPVAQLEDRVLDITDLSIN